jgi:hypothetical protein
MQQETCTQSAKRMKFHLLLLLIGLSHGLASSVQAQPPARSLRIHVSKTGRDTDAGTVDRPFATLERARAAVREARAFDTLLNVEVVVHTGVYHLDRTLEFEPGDSGARSAPVVWRAADGEQVVLSGGRPIRGTWRREPGGLWSIAVPAAKGWLRDMQRPESYTPAPDGPWNFRELYVNGRRAVRARYPNAGDTKPFLFAASGGMDHLVLPPGRAKAAWADAEDAQVNIVPRWRFFNQWNDVARVDTTTGRIDIGPRERHGEIDKGAWFWVEGVRSELDVPGEWHLDHAEGRLYYRPRPGERMETAEVVAPYLNRIIYLKGDVDRGTHVRNLVFRGFTFRHTSYTLGQIEARVHTDGAIVMENATDCSVSDCRFELIGGYACWLHLDTQGIGFERNHVSESGGGGVLMTGARLSYMDDSKVFTPGEKARRVFPIRNRIIGNVVEHCGRIRYYGGGVHIDSRPANMAMAPGSHIAHNHFRDLSRNGIFAFRNQGGHVIEFNEIHDCMQTTIDGAAIHLATMNRLAAPNFLLDNHLYNVWGFEQLPDREPRRTLANGVFLDWATSNTTLRHNTIYNTGEREIKPIMGNWELDITDNLVSPTIIPARLPDQTGPKGSAAHFILPSELTLTGAVLTSQDTAQVRFKGPWQPRQISGMRNLFQYVCRAAAPGSGATATYVMPVRQSGWYKVCLMYFPDARSATNARISVVHANGTERRNWNFRKGDPLGFSVLVGTFYFEQGRNAEIVIDSEGADGEVVADGVGMVRTGD